MVYFYLRFLLIPLALLGWIVFQLGYKKKSWAQVKPDVQLTAFVLIVWMTVYFALFR